MVSALDQNDIRKNYASFYTPSPVARVLTDWAIIDQKDIVLDPSYGGCSFLVAALETLRCLGNPLPGKNIYGVDIDPRARSFVSPLVDAGAQNEQYPQANFFDVDLARFGISGFDVVVGNPPYIRYHDISDEAQKKAAARLAEFDIQISGRASYWAFFLLYSMQFLRRGGRLAMVLPGALLHTDYAPQVRSVLARFFSKITLLLLHDRIFDGTEEESVLVLASGAREIHQSLRIGAVPRVTDLEKYIKSSDDYTREIDNRDAQDELLRAIIDNEVLEVYDRIIASPSVIRLGDWTTIRIGVVTGNNNYFVLSRQEQERWEIPEDCIAPIIRRPTILKGLWVTDIELQPLSDNGARSRLLAVSVDDINLPVSVTNYIQYGETLGVSKARKCRDRRPWYVVPQIFVPPAFVPCMSAKWPRLVINQSRFTCTNNILRLMWKEERLTIDWLRLALGTLSSFCQLSAEIVGRSYGGGVLKVEPKELARLAVPLIPADCVPKLSSRVNALLQQERVDEATEVVDDCLIHNNGLLSRSELARIRSVRNSLYLRRRQHRRNAEVILET